VVFESVTGFIEHLQIVTTSKNYALTLLNTSETTIGHARSCQSLTVFISRCLVVALVVDVSLPLSA
jgi:hypothetical protein